ncbi:MAG: hypothetical protein GY861_18635 [bacterium]|nr:hypothetical protein [bacterium]
MAYRTGANTPSKSKSRAPKRGVAFRQQGTPNVNRRARGSIDVNQATQKARFGEEALGQLTQRDTDFTRRQLEDVSAGAPAPIDPNKATTRADVMRIDEGGVGEIGKMVRRVQDAPSTGDLAGVQTTPAPTTTAPQTTEEANQLIRDFAAQQDTPNVPTRGGPQQSTSSFNDFMAQFQGGAPEAQSTADLYDTLTSAAGIEDIQSQINDLDAQADELEAAFRQEKAGIMDGVAQVRGVLTGRVTAEERAKDERMDVINRARNVLQRQADSKNNIIDQQMKFAQTDYENASNSYNTAFNQQIQLYNAYAAEQGRQQTIEEAAKNNARADLGAMYTLAKDGNLDMTDPNTVRQMQYLETQAGLPVGMYSALDTKYPAADGDWSIQKTGDPFIQDGKQYYPNVMINNTTGEVKVEYAFAEGGPDFSQFAGGAGVGTGTGIGPSAQPTIYGSLSTTDQLRTNKFISGGTEAERAGQRENVASLVESGLSDSEISQITGIGGFNPADKIDLELNLQKRAKGRTDTYTDLRRKGDTIDAGYNAFVKAAKDGQDLNAASQAVILTWNKILDEGSVVRESEYARTGEGQSLINQIEGKLAQWEQGGAGVTEETVKSVYDLSKTLIDNSFASEANSLAPLFNTANQYGLDQDIIFSPENLRVMKDAAFSSYSTEYPSLTREAYDEYLNSSDFDPVEHKRLTGQNLKGPAPSSGGGTAPGSYIEGQQNLADDRGQITYNANPSGLKYTTQRAKDLRDLGFVEGVDFAKGGSNPDWTGGTYVSFKDVPTAVKAYGKIFRRNLGNMSIFAALGNWVGTSEAANYANQVKTLYNSLGFGTININRQVSDLKEDEMQKLLLAQMAKENRRAFNSYQKTYLT